MSKAVEFTDADHAAAEGAFRLFDGVACVCEGQPPADVMAAVTVYLVDVMRLSNVTLSAAQEYLGVMWRGIPEFTVAGDPVVPRAPSSEGWPKATRH